MLYYAFIADSTYISFQHMEPQMAALRISDSSEVNKITQQKHTENYSLPPFFHDAILQD